MDIDKEVYIKLDRLDSRLDAMNTQLAVYNEQLKTHIRRTEALEAEHVLFRKVVYGLLGVGAFAGFAAAVLTASQYFRVIL